VAWQGVAKEAAACRSSAARRPRLIGRLIAPHFSTFLKDAFHQKWLATAYGPEGGGIGPARGPQGVQKETILCQISS